MVLETITNQDLPVIKCVLISHKNNGSSSGESSSDLLWCQDPQKTSRVPRGIRVMGWVYEAATVEVAESGSVTLQGGIISMAILNVTETQAGEYLLHIQSEAANYTVLFTVTLRDTQLYVLRKPYFRKMENQDALLCISESVPGAHRGVGALQFPQGKISCCKEGGPAVVKKEEKVLYELFGTDIRCCARNALGRECTKLFTIGSKSGSSEHTAPVIPESGGTLRIRCKAIHVNHKFGLSWELENKALEEGSYFEMSTWSTNRTMVRILLAFVSSVGRNDTGYYTCSSSKHPSRSALVTILDKGFINATSSQEEYEIDPYEKFCFSVRFRAYPRIRCKWIFSQASFPCEQSGLEDGYSISKFCDHKNKPGEYIFHAENDDAQFTKMFMLNVRTAPRKSQKEPLPFHPRQHLLLCDPWALPPLHCGPHRADLSQIQKRYESQLRMIQVTGPLDNEYFYVDFRDYEYDLKWEFPRENLEFGKVLGSGAFGRVMNATAYGISKTGVSIQVAVKMLKDVQFPEVNTVSAPPPTEKADSCEREALMSELKMMTHLGHHDNIVNLLGACTLSGPVYLIFEYCCYGDLLNYLRSKREKFHRTWTEIFKEHNFSFYPTFQSHSNSSMPGSREVQIHPPLDRLSGSNGNSIHSKEARLPVKWMAPESLFEGIYTIKSDVWSYGILLWEIFSLECVNPYPGIPVDANFYKLIQSGFKMEQPFHATEDIYFVMQSCWAFDSRKRPSFPKLTSFFLECQLAEAEEAMYQNTGGHAPEHPSGYQNRRPVSREAGSEPPPPVPQAQVKSHRERSERAGLGPATPDKL
ncbi:Receptor protein-tyrosine kinase [Apodemus speciosus]|uniref:receptor protein-tyrosine kinase n=1 Tax=Apodemus speciosus TaxID=105296 RepID=A0ABQ0ETY9_APOSI